MAAPEGSHTIFLCNVIDPWYSDESSQGSCSANVEDFEEDCTLTSGGASFGMAFPARMSERLVLDGRLQDRTTSAQVCDLPL